MIYGNNNPSDLSSASLKKSYSAMQISKLGSLAEMTLGGTGSRGDGGNTGFNMGMGGGGGGMNNDNDDND
ncbi:hypothetical protein CAL7716_094720 [Calothrix sp. PCC 7716]|nr:hypothetical protein CAL7716_094720 [Calothrix sp. PCC 7716]